MVKLSRAAALGALTTCALLAVPAWAHPLGNFTINHLAKVRVERTSIAVRYVLDIAEIPTFQIMRAREASGQFDAADLRAWAEEMVPKVQDGLVVEADGRRLRLSAGEPRALTRPGAGGLPTLYWSADFLAPLAPRNADRHITVSDRLYPERIGWKDVVVAPAREPTNELRSYPNALLSSPRDVASVEIDVAPGGAVRVAAGPPPAEAGQSRVPQIRSNALSDMLARGAKSPLVVLLTLLAAVGLGALHAMEPGHGKTLMAVSLVGARATPKQALILALGLTFAHTAGVLALGLVMLAAAQWIVPENVYPWITLVSGVAVAVLGATALARFVRSRRGAEHDNDHGHGHDHHHHRAVPQDRPLSFGGVLLAAMSGNIAPCPAALVVLLTALTLHQVGYGLVVIVAFSAGLAAVLTTLGIALVRGATWLSARPQFEKIVGYGPLASAAIIAIIGAVMVGQGLAAGSLHVSAVLATILTLGAIAGYALRPGHTHEHAMVVGPAVVGPAEPVPGGNH